MLCVDEYHRFCHSIIVSFKINYEKQVLITNIKSEVHCSICTVSSRRRQDLMTKWSSRTHEYTKTQLERQQKEQFKSMHSNWIYFVKNFAWKHDLLNIHKEMMINILHQLHNHDIVNHFMSWVRQLLEIKTSKTKKDRNKNVYSFESSINQLDKRFQLMIVYVNLKHFNNFSEIK